MGISIIEKSKQQWLDVCLKVNKAVVFIDNTLAECLHWNGGAMLLYKSGALDIKHFSSFESGRKDQHKSVFLISSALVGTSRQILRDIVQGSQFYYTIVISSLFPAVHSLLSPGSSDDMHVFHDIEDELLNWMGNKSYTAEVEYLPLVTAPVHPHLMLLPEQPDLFPLLPKDIKELQLLFQGEARGNQSELDIADIPNHIALQLKMLVCSLNSWLEQLGVTEDIYCLGRTSKMVASELASLSWAKTRRKNSPSKTSLVLVDRTLDITSAVSHNMETLLDRVLSLLPKLPGHNNDVAVNMESICSASSNELQSVIAPGCLSHSSDESATQLLQTMALSKQKEALMEVNRQIVEAAMQEKLIKKLSVKPRISADQLTNHVSLFQGKNNLIRKHCGLLQMVLAGIQTLNSNAYTRQDSLLGVEKGLLQALEEEGGMSPLVQLTHTLNRELDKISKERLYTLEDIFLLLLYIYSLAENVTSNQEQEERILQGALCGALKDKKMNEWPKFMKILLEDDGFTEEGDVPENHITSILETIFEKLKLLSEARDGFQKYWSVFEPGSMTSQATVKPLLKQLVEDICDPAKPEMTDLEYKSTGLRQLLKSGFGLFMNVSKPRPSDHPMLIIFVIGGITSTEVKQMQDTIVSQKSNLQLIVSSNRLLRHEDILHNILIQECLIPPDES